MIRFIITCAVALMLTSCAESPVPEETGDLNEDAAAFEISRALPRAGEGRMTPELESRVEALIEAYRANEPTTKENATERALTVYDWGNALTLEGQWIHPDLTALASVLSPGRIVRLNPNFLQEYFDALDDVVADLTLLRDKPDAFGPLELEILVPAIVNQHHSVSMTYTVGSQPIVQGGGFVVPNHFRFLDFEYQTIDPEAPNYVSISTDRDGVVFETSSVRGVGQYSTRLRGGFMPRLFFRVKEGQLEQGDTVTIIFGDTKHGSPGLRTIHYSNTALRHAVWVLTAPLAEGGILHTLREPPIPLLGDSAVAAKGFMPATAETGEEVILSVRFEDRFRNRAETEIPESFNLYLNESFFGEYVTDGQAITRIPLSFDEAGVYRFEITAAEGEIMGQSDPILVETRLEDRIFWGETHSHSGWAEGLGLAEAVFQFARDESRLDFITLSEHDLWMDLGEWATMLDLVNKYQDDGNFLTFMGYEFTVDPPQGGHHNVLFRNPDTAVLASQVRFPAIEDLHRALKSAVPEEDALIIPHAHMPGDWTRSDHGLERLVEIVSYHGTFEWFGRNYLDEGWVVGFIGASDDHDGSPGYRPRALGTPRSDNFGGLAAVYADSLNRDEIFDGLRDRRVYATNGARIIMQAEMNGHKMGQFLGNQDEVRELTGRIIGTAPIQEISLVKNGIELQTLDYAEISPEEYGDTVLLELSIQFDSNPRTLRSSFPDAIYQGSLEFNGVDVIDVRAPVSEALNSETEYVILDPDRTSASFRMRSGGRLVTILVELPTPSIQEGQVIVDLSESTLAHANAETIPPITLNLKDITETSFSLDLDGSAAFHKFRARYIRDFDQDDRTFDFVDGSKGFPGDYYYLRVRQVDGGMAWSSPWWVGDQGGE